MVDRVKTLIHVHTNYSLDSNISPEALAAFAEREGFGCVVITDHDTVEGAHHFASIADVQAVIGEEITSRDGDVIGLFLDRHIPPGMSARETALAIKEQGGLVLVPHPFIRILGRGLGDKVWDMMDLIDAVEVCNSQNLLRAPDLAAERFATEQNFVKFAGSDSHAVASIAPSYQYMRDFSGPEDFLDALAAAELVRGRHPFSYFFSAGYRTLRYLAGAGVPPGCGLNYAEPTVAGVSPALVPARACTS